MAESGALLKDLFHAYADPIREILENVHVYLDQQNDLALKAEAERFPVDELCVLKFILSALRCKTSNFKNIAYERLIETLHFRKANVDIIEKARTTKELTYIAPSVVGGFLGSELVVVTYWGRADLNKIIEQFGTVEALVARGYCGAEQVRLLLDKQSRTTGRLCKLLSLVDLHGLTMGHANMKMMKAMSILTRANEIHVPQMTGRIVLVRPPSFIRAVINFSRPFLSKASLEKMVICKGSNHADRKTTQSCPFISKFANGDLTIPRDLGGSLDHAKGEVTFD